jgi:hypothetical protein
MSNNAKISVYRKADDFRDRNAIYRVAIDGHVVGELNAGEGKTFRVAAGTHLVKMRYFWLSSNTLSVSPGPGEETELISTSSGIAGLFVNLFFRWSHYLRLRQMTPEDLVDMQSGRKEPVPVPRNLGTDPRV